MASPNLIAPAVWLEATTFRLAASYDNSVKRHSDAQTRARVSDDWDDWYSVSIIGCKRIARSRLSRRVSRVGTGGAI